MRCKTQGRDRKSGQCHRERQAGQIPLRLRAVRYLLILLNLNVMPLNQKIRNLRDLIPSPEFTEAYELISSKKGWKKWPKVVSKGVYEHLWLDARNCIGAFGFEERRVNEFMSETIDYYLENGTLKPGYEQYVWELGLFAILKRRIDEAVSRRVRAIRAAALRRERRETAKASLPVEPGQHKSVEHGDEPCGNRHVDEHANYVVGDGDEGSGGNRRVYLEFLKSERDKCAEDGCEHHNAEDRSRNSKGGYLMAGSEGEIVVDEHQQRNDAAVEEPHTKLFEELT